MEKAEYLDPKRTLLVYKNFKYNVHKRNENGTIRWRCESCKSVSLTVDSEDRIIRKPEEIHRKPKECKKMCQVELECMMQYEILKYEFGTDTKFSFANRYSELLSETQAKYDPKLVSEFFPSEAKARSACSEIREKNNIKEAKVTKELEITDKQKFIQINQVKELILDKIYALNVKNSHWILLTNINHTFNTESVDMFNWGATGQQEWYVYDSMKNETNCQAASQVFRLMYPEKSWEKVNLVHVESQTGKNDCGLFVIAYAQMLTYSKDPAFFKINQASMREKYNFFSKYGYLEEFESLELNKKEKKRKSVIVRW
ncbi:unnamed protein product [Brachionus calyciflorus]|uniref:Ubiquitin-like protease family profile domain-containing protein n=1 Tax=Brachionus calyciflorus TaxID=104777 RepID=A0A813ZBQ2_9BILA|nr:unnamed protein product [Brachionus calyciflorus]